MDTFIDRIRQPDHKLGVLLYQVPPGLKRDDVRLEEFLQTLPGDRQHAFEFRQELWFNEAVYRILRRQNVAFCIFDMPGITTPLVVTAGFAYIRLHGATSLYSSNYSDDELASWTKRIGSLSPDVNQVFIYFNNDIGANTVRNAITLRKKLTGF